MGRKFPDYVFYDNSRSPLCVLEVKKPKEKNKSTLDKALEQAKNYARKINCPLAIASNGFVYISHHLDFQREYLINNKPLNDLPTPQELAVVRSQYFFNTYRGKVLTNQEEFRKLLKKIDDKL